MLKKLFLVSIASFFTACQEENPDAWVAKYQDDIITIRGNQDRQIYC